MVDDVYKLTLTMNVMKDQRRKMVSDFSDCIDYDMMKGLQRFNYPAEFAIYSEFYHVVWLDRHWNQLVKGLEKVPLKEDKIKIEQYFSKCFLELAENFKVDNKNYTSVFLEILRIKIKTLRDMIQIVQKNEKNYSELEYAHLKHREIYKNMIDELNIKQ